MAAASPEGSLREDLTCVICCDLFREPVMLACMHHFCKPCITRYWRGTPSPVTCPQCRKEFSTKQFQTNYLVAAVVEKVRASTADTQNVEKKVKEALESHRQRKEDIINIIRRDKDKMDTIKRVTADLQTRVCGEFRALRQILDDEETSAREQLNREQDAELEKVQQHLEPVEHALSELEENIKALEQASATTEKNMLTEVPQLSRPYVPVDVAPEFDINAFSIKYTAPLQYIIWRKMFKSLKPGPTPLTFDINTAHPSIYLSADQTIAVEDDAGVKHKSNNNKRFLQCVNVLASQGFHLGKHYWEVELGSKPKWDLGVAAETVDRHARVKLSPENGYWTIRLRNRNQYSVGTQPPSMLHLVSPPQRVGVFLECEERRVSFYNADDMTLIYQFTNGPRGKVFPFFSPCISDGDQKPHPIKLLHHPPVPLSG